MPSNPGDIWYGLAAYGEAEDDVLTRGFTLRAPGRVRDQPKHGATCAVLSSFPACRFVLIRLRAYAASSTSTTFARDLLDWDEVPAGLSPLIDKLWAAYSRDGLAARTLTVKVKYADFRQIISHAVVPAPRRSCRVQ